MDGITIDNLGADLIKENQIVIGVLNPYDNKKKLDELIKKKINLF